MTRTLSALVLLLAVALAPAVLAQEHEKPSTVSITINQPLVVGTVTLQPGQYHFECKMIDGQHTMIVSRDRKEVTRVPCTRIDMPTRVPKTSYGSVTKGDVQVLTELRIHGEMFAHRLVTP